VRLPTIQALGIASWRVPHLRIGGWTDLLPTMNSTNSNSPSTYSINQAACYVHSVALPRPADPAFPWEIRLALVDPSGQVLAQQVRLSADPRIPVLDSSPDAIRDPQAPPQADELTANIVALEESLNWLPQACAQAKPGQALPTRVVFCPARKGVVEFCKVPLAFAHLEGLPIVAYDLSVDVVAHLEKEFEPVALPPSEKSIGMPHLPLVQSDFPPLP
jgi:hypothetical protein